MTERAVRRQITAFVATELAGDPDMDLQPDVELLMTGIVDSMGAVRLVGFIEETWDVRVPPQDVTIEHFGTIDDITAYVVASAAGSRADVSS